MHRSKAEVDKHVESLVAKLSLKEFKSRAYSVARLYFDAGDYASCRRYAEQYLSVREDDAAAHKLLAHALHRLGDKEKALEQYKTSLDIDPSQNNLILDICELLSDDEVYIDPGRARYWCERAEEKFPRHPATFNLRERLLAHTEPDPEALLRLLRAELQHRPRDAALHARLLKQHLLAKNYKDAFDHSFSVEFGEHDTFRNNYAWYEVLSEVLALDEEGRAAGEWRRRLLELTVAERLCSLSLANVPCGSGKSLAESAASLHRYDQLLQRATTSAAGAGADFHAALLHHHRGQFVFYTASFLLKKAKKDQMSYREAVRAMSPLFLLAWHTSPPEENAPWLSTALEQQRSAVRRWRLEGSYRCSQVGHCLLAGVQERTCTFVDRVSQFCSGTRWKDKIYEKLFNKEQLSQSNTSHFLSAHFENPILRLPRRTEVQAYDVEAQRMYPNSLHHVVWMLMDYKSFAQFKCVLFESLRPACQNYPNCGPETLNRLDVEAFLYAAAMTAAQHSKSARHTDYQAADVPEILPANMTELLCSLAQIKWWDCATKVSQNEIGTELSDIRATLRRGMEVVRCVDNHGLHPQLLCKLGAIFSERAKLSTNVDDKDNLAARAALYYSTAIPLLERLKGKMVIRMPEKRMFDYVHKDLSTKEILAMLEESKLYMGESYLNESENEKAIETLTGLKSARAGFLLSRIYVKMAFDEIGMSKEHLTSEDRSKHVILLSKAKEWAYTTNDRLKSNQDDKLYTETHNLIEKIENALSRIDPDTSNSHDYEGKYSSDENVSSGESHGDQMHLQMRAGNSLFRNVSSTPKHRSGSNATHYKSAIDAHMLDSSRTERKHLERIETQIKSLHKKDCAMNAFMEHTKSWIEENRNLGEQVRDLKNNLADKIISRINTNIQDTVDQFKLLKLSVDQVKDKIGEYRNECRSDVGDLKKEVAQLKKEVSKLKSSNADQTIDESDLYNLDDYQASEAAPAFSAQHPFNAAQVLPAFNQRMVPPVAIPPAAYSIYGQNLYTLYNQFSQLAQPPAVPTAPLFDPARAPANYPGVFPTTDQLYPDMPHFHPPPVIPPASQPPQPVSRPAPVHNKEVPRSLPANVVITSSDPMPTRTSVPQPILSVTIPPQHLKNSPHNYQIPLPATGANPIVSSVFNSGIVSSAAAAPAKTFTGWNQSSTFGTTPTLASNTTPKVSSTFDSTKFSLFDSPKTSGANDSSNLSGLNASFISPNISLNKSRTISEKSNTSVENYDPCPDFKPIIPLPAEVQVTTGEEDETTIFSARAKLFRFVEKQWKERGLGEMKLLKHKVTGKVRVLMRREQIHKVCANHIITPEMEMQPMKNETKAYVWVANDFADEAVVLEKFCVRFKSVDIAKEFYETFENARKELKAADGEKMRTRQKDERKFGGSWTCESCFMSNATNVTKCVSCQKVKGLLPTPDPIKTSATSKPSTDKVVMGGFTFSSTPTFKAPKETDTKQEVSEEKAVKPNLFGSLTFKSQSGSPFANIFGTPAVTDVGAMPITPVSANTSGAGQLNTSDAVEEFEPSAEFKPVVPLPALVDQKTGEEDETVAFEHRAKLLRFDPTTKEWKERGLGNIKILIRKGNDQKVRLLMRREIVMKVCCNHGITKDMKFQRMPNHDKAVTWCAKDFSEGELTTETFCLRFKTALICDDFMKAVEKVQGQLNSASDRKPVEEKPQTTTTGFGEQFKPKPGSWSCTACYTSNLASASKCIACEQAKAPAEKSKSDDTNLPLSVANWGDKFKPKAGSWECAQCLIRNEGHLEYCGACESPKDPSKPKKETKSILDAPGAPKFSFGIPKAADTTKQPAPVTFGFNSKAPATFTFTPAAAAASGPFAVTSQKAEETSRTTPFDRLASAGKGSPGSVSFAKESGTFDFVMKPKSGKGKSPLKSPQSDRGDDSDNEKYEEDDGHHIHFAPVIPLPDKVEVTTGEENEIELYSHRAKLFRFVAGEWKERGLGNVKILKHKENGKLRVLMRREQIHKICLNHALSADVVYTSKDDKTWLFTANDFSEGELKLQQFCLRFKTKAIASEFKEAVDDARGGATTVAKKEPASAQGDPDDVVFVKETQATPEQKQKAKELMLPENFFTYQLKEPCTGCRGCEQNEETALLAPPSPMPSHPAATTPSKSVYSASPTNSIFTTPMTMNKSADTTIFQTPMGTSDADRSWRSDDRNTSLNKENSTPNMGDIASSVDSTAFTLFRTAYMNSKNNEVSSKPRVPLLATAKLPPAASPVQNPIFGASGDKSGTMSIFGNSVEHKGTFESMFHPNFASVPVSSSKSFFSIPPVANSETKTMFEGMSIFGNTVDVNTEGTPVFGLGADKKQEATSIFGSEKIVLGAANNQKPEVKSIFGFGADSESKSIFVVPKVKPDPKTIFSLAADRIAETKSIIGSAANQKADTKPMFGSTADMKPKEQSVFEIAASRNQESKSIFGSAANQKAEPKSVFGSASEKKPEEVSIFGSAVDQKPENSIFGFATVKPNVSINPTFGSSTVDNKPMFGSNGGQNAGSIFGAPKATNGTPTETSKTITFGNISNASVTTPNLFSALANAAVKEQQTPESDSSSVEPAPFSTDTGLSFAALSTSNGPGIAVKKSDNFQWEGAGQQLFGGKQDPARLDKSAEEGGAGAGAGADEEYDPHYEPIVPLPDKIVVTTGEEDEEKLFGERAKLYRYDEKAHEWKERGVGEMKLLYHPERKTYRLLLRREQVYKAVLNMLLFKDLELLPMKKSDQAWTWAAVNCAETPTGEMETLACRFKNVDLARAFRDKVVEAVRKLQAADAVAYRERQEAAVAVPAAQPAPPANLSAAVVPSHLQPQQQQHEEQETVEGEEGEEGHAYEDYDEDYEDYYNEEEEQVHLVSEASGAARVVSRGAEGAESCDGALLQLLYDNDVYSHKLQLTDANTGEILADTILYAEMPFHLGGATATWTGSDYTTGQEVEKTVTFTFPDVGDGEAFYHAVQECKNDLS